MRPGRFLVLIVPGSWGAWAVQAAVPNESPEQLKKRATHIVVGKVTDNYTSKSKKGDAVTIKIIAEIEIQKSRKAKDSNEVNWSMPAIGRQTGTEKRPLLMDRCALYRVPSREIWCAF